MKSLKTNSPPASFTHSPRSLSASSPKPTRANFLSVRNLLTWDSPSSVFMVACELSSSSSFFFCSGASCWAGILNWMVSSLSSSFLASDFLYCRSRLFSYSSSGSSGSSLLLTPPPLRGGSMVALAEDLLLPPPDLGELPSSSANRQSSSDAGRPSCMLSTTHCSVTLYGVAPSFLAASKCSLLFWASSGPTTM